MRWIYVATIVLFATAVAGFAVQHLDAVTVAFLSFKIRGPLAALAIAAYVLGTATGGGLLALPRRS